MDSNTTTSNPTPAETAATKPTIRAKNQALRNIAIKHFSGQNWTVNGVETEDNYSYPQLVATVASIEDELARIERRLGSLDELIRPCRPSSAGTLCPSGLALLVAERSLLNLRRDSLWWTLDLMWEEYEDKYPDLAEDAFLSASICVTNGAGEYRERCVQWGTVSPEERDRWMAPYWGRLKELDEVPYPLGYYWIGEDDDDEE